ncbi:hypothetical protein KY285_008114 [Solanum tuberosum]|nr:hypothetical protein KY285_008114 [Solanum tuberosum]
MHVQKKYCEGKKRVKEVNNVRKLKRRCVYIASTAKNIVNSDDDFEDLPPQFQSNKLKNKVVPEKKKSVLEKKSGKDAKPQKRLANNVILPESGDPVFGSAGVIGNPMGFARSMGLGLKDFLSAPVQSVFQTRAGFIKGMAQGTSSLLSNTVYALSDSATQFRKATHKGIVAFTFDDQAVGNMERHQKGISSHSKGVINEFFEGLTGLLQSPIKGAERHGLPGVLSGIALGVTGLVARPAASILDITGKTAQSIRNRSKLHNLGSHRFRVRLPRHLNRELPLRPYSWEEAIGVSVLREAEDHIKLKDETLVVCKALRHDGKFVILTERLILIVSCSSIVKYRMPEFQGVPANPEWLVETEIGMDSVIHADNDDDEVHIVGSSSDALLRQNHISHKRSWGPKGKRWNNNPRTSLPQLQTNLVFTSKDEAEDFLQVLLSTIDKAKEQGRSSVHLLHQSSLRQL